MTVNDKVAPRPEIKLWPFIVLGLVRYSLNRCLIHTPVAHSSLHSKLMLEKNNIRGISIPITHTYGDDLPEDYLYARAQNPTIRPNSLTLLLLIRPVT